MTLALLKTKPTSRRKTILRPSSPPSKFIGQSVQPATEQPLRALAQHHPIIAMQRRLDFLDLTEGAGLSRFRFPDPKE